MITFRGEAPYSPGRAGKKEEKNMNKIKTIRVENTMAPLYHRYPIQQAAQPAHIELNLEDKTLSASYNAEIGNAVPFSVHHGHRRWSGITQFAPGKAINDIMDEITPLCERVLAGYESEWDGNNHVARLTEDALEADEEIESRLMDWTPNNLATDLLEWDYWYVELYCLLDDLSGTQDAEEFVNFVHNALAAENYINGTSEDASEWAIDYIARSIDIEENHEKWSKALPGWVKTDERVIAAIKSWEE
jgi:hypothetical protein